MANKIVQFTDASGNNIYPMGYAQGGVKRDLLWSNPNPTSNFEPQTISLDLSDYGLIYITFKIYNDNVVGLEKTSIVGNKDRIVGVNAEASALVTYYRPFESNQNSVMFENGYRNATVTNTRCVPIQIYGIKTSYLVPTEVHGLTYIDDDTNGNITLYNNDGTKALYPNGQIGGIDFTRIVASFTKVGDITYTATEDCWYRASYEAMQLWVDGVQMQGGTSYVYGCINGLYPLKKGQTMRCVWGNNNMLVWFYGVKH